MQIVSALMPSLSLQQISFIQKTKQEYGIGLIGLPPTLFQELQADCFFIEECEAKSVLTQKCALHNFLLFFNSQ